MAEQRGSQPPSGKSGGWLSAAAILVLILLVSRLGLHIPLPGTDPAILERLRASPGAGGAALARISLFALWLTPFLGAWVILEIFRGSRPEADVARWRRWLTAALALIQGWGVAGALEDVRGLVPEPGFEFRLTAAFSMAASTMLLVWLGEQITRLGVCDGIWLLLAADSIAELPGLARTLLAASRSGMGLSSEGVAAIAVVLAVAVALIVLVERAGREVEVAQPDGTRRTLFFKLDRVTIVPAYIASWAAAVPGIIVGVFSQGSADHGMSPGQPMFLVAYAIFIFIATYMVTAIRLAPRRIASGLARGNATIVDVPAPETASWLSRTFIRTTALTAVYLVAICLLPELLITIFSAPVYVGGPTLLIMVIVALDIFARATGTGRRDELDRL